MKKMEIIVINEGPFLYNTYIQICGIASHFLYFSSKEQLYM